jgi:uncharacterized membrane protein
MLSNHYPLAFASQWNWLIAALVFLMGVTIRHFFNTMHSRKVMLWWTWAATAIIFLVIVWLSSVPLQNREAAMTPAVQRFAQAEGFADVHAIVQGRCSMCHAAEPFWDGILWAPKGVRLETEADVAGHARAIYVQAGVTHAMPPGNLTWIAPEERAAIVAWYRAATGDGS